MALQSQLWNSRTRRHNIQFGHFITSFLKDHEAASNLLKNEPEIAAEIASKEMGVVDK